VRRPDKGVIERSGFVVGLACSEQFIVHGMAHRTSLDFEYRVSSGNGEPLGALRMHRDRDKDRFVGAVVAVRGKRLVSFRSRPWPQVLIWRMTIE
jgi:hypothetical protein